MPIYQFSIQFAIASRFASIGTCNFQFNCLHQLNAPFFIHRLQIYCIKCIFRWSWGLVSKFKIQSDVFISLLISSVDRHCHHLLSERAWVKCNPKCVAPQVQCVLIAKWCRIHHSPHLLDSILSIYLSYTAQSGQTRQTRHTHKIKQEIFDLHFCIRVRDQTTNSTTKLPWRQCQNEGENFMLL